jgi:hypothetical protein
MVDNKSMSATNTHAKDVSFCFHKHFQLSPGFLPELVHNLHCFKTAATATA